MNILAVGAVGYRILREDGASKLNNPKDGYRFLRVITNFTRKHRPITFLLYSRDIVSASEYTGRISVK
jgi:hypothetical protein